MADSSQILKEMREKAASQAYMQDLLERNAEVPFVKRILSPGDYPAVLGHDEAGNRWDETHRMSSAEFDDVGHIAYPTLRYQDKSWVRDADPRTALKSGNYIAFPTHAEADTFAKGSWKSYKPKKKSSAPAPVYDPLGPSPQE